VATAFVNRSSIDGLGSQKRRIPLGLALDESYLDQEGIGAPSAPLLNDSPVELTPLVYRQKVAVSVEAARLRFPGLSYQQVVDRVSSGDPSTIPLIADCVTASADAHMRKVEREVFAAGATLSRSRSSSANNPTAAAASVNLLIDAMTDYRIGIVGTPNEGSPLAGDPVFLLNQKQTSDIVKDVVANGNDLWANPGADIGFFTRFGNVTRDGLVGSVMGAPIYACENKLMAKANTGNADNVGLLIRPGSGPTENNDSRGAIEVCIGFEPVIEYSYDADTGLAYIHSRMAFAAKVHTQAHGIKIVSTA